MKTALQTNRPLWKATLLSTLLGLLTGCQYLDDVAHVDPLNNIAYKLNYQPAPTIVQGLIVDAKTEEPLTIPVRVSLFGKDAGRTVTFDGSSALNFTTEKGDLYLGLKGTSPTEATPAELRIVVDADGYVSSGKTLRLSQALNELFVIRLVKQSDTPVGVAALNRTLQTNASGATLADQQIQVTNAGGDSVSATKTLMQIPANTVLKDAKGQPVTGTIVASVVTFSGESAAALKAFPGGLDAPIAKDIEGRSNTTFPVSPGGFVAIKMVNERRQAVSTFSQPVTVQMSVSPTALNPATDKPYMAGEPILIYSYNEQTGEWVYEKQGMVEQQGAGLVVSMQITHLSFWDWLVNLFSIIKQTFTPDCDLNYTLTTLPDNYPYRYELRRGGYYFAGGTSQSRRLSFRTAPKQNFELVLMTPEGGVLGRFTNTGCGNIDVRYAFPPRPVEVYFYVQATCPNGKQVEINPTVTLFCGKPGTPSVYWAPTTLVNGRGYIRNLASNTDYTVIAYYNGIISYPLRTGSISNSRKFLYQLSPTCSICR